MIFTQGKVKTKYPGGSINDFKGDYKAKNKYKWEIKARMLELWYIFWITPFKF